MSTETSKHPESNLGNLTGKTGALTISAVQGPLGALVKQGKAELSAADREKINTLTKRSDATSNAAMERLRNGDISVEIASDFSASTQTLNKILGRLSATLTQQIASKYPLARIGFGIFGGSGLLKKGESARILDSTHQATDGWESTFGEFAAEYAKNPDPTREKVLISFHDARPEINNKLFQAVKEINTLDAVVFIVFKPSSGSTDNDKQVLCDLADPHAGFKRGIFIDLTGVDETDKEIMEKIMVQLISAVADSNKKAFSSTNDPQIAKILANTRLRTLVSGIAERARRLSDEKRERRLLKS